MGVRHIEAHVDSMLVAGQINGQYEAKGDIMALYLNQAKTLLQTFYSYKVHHINRSENKPADALSKLASTSFQHLAKDVRIEVLSNPSVPLREVSVIQTGTTSWMTPIIMYLQSGILPENKAEARKIQYKSEHYQMADGRLYRKSYLGPLLRCVDADDANYLIREVHEGICGIHAGPRMVVAKVMNAGYYWPGMHLDAVKELRKCSGCQRHAPKTMRPKNALVPVTTAWPFQQWGIDMVGPFPEAPGAVKFIIVAVDYFTKWVEAKALASTTSTVVKRFIWEQIICRFGLPLRIITDNGTNFAADDLERWFKELNIEHTFSSVAHPQGNGQVEAVNKSIVDGIKARLGEKRRGWVDELPSILWAHRTMPKTSNGETPFSLVYGSEAVIPAEIGLPSPRMLSMNLINNEEERRIDLDLLEERREMAAINEAKYKSKLEKYYNSRVRICTFNPGDYVLRDNEASNTEKPGKLAPKWEGPYIIDAVLGKGAYKLRTMNDKEVPRTWNAQQLRKCYI
ncbi:putative nucleotidyltransferase, Ribonuclease H [Helianthus annuus]|nr:putative nucleotidyltransferase, Ribonuclease H [Helianthus annuus]